MFRLKKKIVVKKISHVRVSYLITISSRLFLAPAPGAQPIPAGGRLPSNREPWSYPCRQAFGARGPAGTEWPARAVGFPQRSEEHTSELQSLMRISYAVFCLKKNK